jgi:hypothetical protein
MVGEFPVAVAYKSCCELAGVQNCLPRVSHSRGSNGA